MGTCSFWARALRRVTSEQSCSSSEAMEGLVSYPDPHPPAILFGWKSGSGDYLQNPWRFSGFGKDQSDCRNPIPCTIVT